MLRGGDCQRRGEGARGFFARVCTTKKDTKEKIELVQKPFVLFLLFVVSLGCSGGHYATLTAGVTDTRSPKVRFCH